MPLSTLNIACEEAIAYGVRSKPIKKQKPLLNAPNKREKSQKSANKGMTVMAIARQIISIR
ncbi:MAG: hypothetical protein KME42_19440 [Tildeniella nuda ZEHNDER 1965/U140]|jgi:hypothetical protein|nr:hypothetical protein [Tildeniella nuda ZEHNDER 1965/U140]